MKIKQAIETLEDAAAEFKGTVEDDSVGRNVRLQVCAPKGKVWAANSATHIVVATSRGPQEWLDDAVKFGLDDIKYGLVDETEE